jgi:hypothetical protein
MNRAGFGDPLLGPLTAVWAFQRQRISHHIQPSMDAPPEILPSAGDAKRNIRGHGRRLSAISASRPANRKCRDQIDCPKSPASPKLAEGEELVSNLLHVGRCWKVT